MAIIKCPECGHQISDKAPVCPSCGVEIAGKVIKCPNCGEVYFKVQEMCPNCHRPTYQAQVPPVTDPKPVTPPAPDNSCGTSFTGFSYSISNSNCSGNSSPYSTGIQAKCRGKGTAKTEEARSGLHHISHLLYSGMRHFLLFLRQCQQEQGTGGLRICNAEL